MALTTQETSDLLNRLQTEVNRVLEQTGRIFAAAKDDNKSFPVAQVTRLRQILPVSIDRFHTSLDSLEESLQTATLVMRRDLALCRERANTPRAVEPTTTKANGVSAKSDEVFKPGTAPVDKPEDRTSVEKLKEAPAEDVSMQDIQPDEPNDANNPSADGSIKIENATDLPSEDIKLEDQKVDSDAQDGKETIAKSSESALQIDTQTQPKVESGKADEAEEDRPPDTATYTNDLESLFGVPTSAGPGDAPEFNMDPNSSQDFDFGFGNDLTHSPADNDNISALLPGLQDYANTQPTEGGETDFDALFSTDVPMGNDGEGNDQQMSTEHRDSTFDDLLDFADFNPADYADGNASGSNQNQGFDFSFD